VIFEGEKSVDIKLFCLTMFSDDCSAVSHVWFVLHKVGGAVFFQKKKVGSAEAKVPYHYDLLCFPHFMD